MVIKDIPQMIDSFVDTIKPLDIDIGMLFIDNKEFILYLRKTDNEIVFINSKSEEIPQSEIKDLKFKDVKIGIEYNCNVLFMPNKFQSILESISMNQEKLCQSIRELNILRSWLEKYPEIANMKGDYWDEY